MSSRILPLTRVLARQQSRQRHRPMLIGSCLGLTIGTGVILHTSPRKRFDSISSSSPRYSTSSSTISEEREKRGKGTLDPELMKQLSGGSVSGFLSGVLVAVFSRTLVLLLGVGVILVQVAASYGIDIIDRLRVKQRLGKSRVLDALEKNPVFKLSFGLFFALSAFMEF
ncbi:hypothetical protein F4777DRAFT_406811 [Nemania sp. FL0916]|nr:hypothetical protein F4777DRAFT_406811 [Nemania sp. FL0916]